MMFKPTLALSPSTAQEPAASNLGDLPSWDLTHIYPSAQSQEYKDALASLKEKATAFAAKWKGKLSEAATKTGPEGLGAAIAEYEAFADLAGRIGSFAGLTYYSDTSDPANGKLYGDADALLTDAGSIVVFFTLELNSIDDAVLEECLGSDPQAAHYRSWLIDLRLEKPHQLSDELTQLFMEKSMTSAGAFNRLFDETMADLRFEIDGKSLSIEQALNLLQDPDREKRREAAQALSATFQKNIRLFTLITNTLAKDSEISSRWHKFDDIADSRHLSNRVEREVVDALTAAVKNAYPRLSHRYYAMKARWLGMEQMEFWDRNAPLPDSSTRDISWAEAKDTVLSAYGAFDPELAKIAQRFFDENWIDAPARPGKAPGAFAHPTTPSAHPYVLVNYLGKPRDVATLAHELGHGVHQVLAGGQGALMCSTPLTLAETASVFGEMLTFRSMLDKITDKKERKAMLARKVEDMINTVVRQIAFYDFERRVHTARKEGELTSEQIGQLWLDVQVESLGDTVKISEGYETWWSYIPHFIHSPFYVYAYAFGDCLVNSLYAVYQNGAPEFQQKYFELLKAGGTKHHSELLAPFGLDASDPSFWDKGLSMIEGLIDELEELDRALDA
jgi:oligoendopeptidase F